ncbi:MAG: hypothetical protein IKK48_04115 [Firmicutes bacterium]|nr:hypothetical protein [Bacillota bacterium]
MAGRLYYVQVLCTEELTAAAQSQQMIPVIQENSKGTIYDRYMKPLTGDGAAYYYLIHKDNIDPYAKHLLSSMKAEEAGEKGEDYYVYRTTHFAPDESNLLQSRYKAYGFVVDVRYDEPQIAEALIRDLDQMYADMLEKEEPAFYFLGNASGYLVRGTGMRGVVEEGEKTPVSLITTIDGALQQEIEGIFDVNLVEGCAVVTDTSTGQVLAMVNRSGSSSKMEPEANLAVERAYPLGKSYRLIQRAAGILKVKPFEMAQELGLGEPVFDDYPGENSGSIEAEKQITATAVQVNRILTTLANRGNVMDMVLVMSTVREESIPCMEMTGDAGVKIEELCSELAQKPFVQDRWAFGYNGAYAMTLYLEKGNPKKLYHDIEEVL